MSDELTDAATSALRSAAERLGVDPYRLSRFLGEGRLADIMNAMARPNVAGSRRILGLAEAYLDFLEREIEIREGERPARRRDRA